MRINARKSKQLGWHFCRTSRRWPEDFFSPNITRTSSSTNPYVEPPSKTHRDRSRRDGDCGSNECEETSGEHVVKRVWGKGEWGFLKSLRTLRTTAMKTTNTETTILIGKSFQEPLRLKFKLTTSRPWHGSI